MKMNFKQKEIVKVKNSPRIASERQEDVQNVILMSAAAQPISEIVSFQLVNRTLFFASQDWDRNYDGLLSLNEVFTHPDAPLTIPAMSKDRKSTRLNSSHANISYAVFCLKK